MSYQAKPNINKKYNITSLNNLLSIFEASPSLFISIIPPGPWGEWLIFPPSTEAVCKVWSVCSASDWSSTNLRGKMINKLI